jgi:ATP-dependent Zn protease
MPNETDKTAGPQVETGADAPSDDYFADIDALVREYQNPPPGMEPEPLPRLADMHGLGPAKRWAESLVRDLRDVREGRISFNECDAGCLLAGPPGTGKTTLARVLAQEAGVHFIATSAVSWLSHSYLGQVLEAVREDFASARANAPCILFIDEVDGLADRTAVEGRYQSYWNAFIGCVLEEMQGFRAQPGVILLGATNYLDAVDPALLRSGRFDRVVPVPVPEPEDLARILRQKLGSDLAGEDLMTAATLGMGGTGADAERWVRGARRRARYEERELTVEDLLAEICEAVDGLDADLLRRCAVHEAGHAVAAIVHCEAVEVGISLVNRAAIAGCTRAASREEALTPEAARRRLAYLLAGRAAEEVVLGEVSGGAGGMERSDLALSTRLAVDMVTTYGIAGPEPLIYWGAGVRPSQLPPPLYTEVRRELNVAYKEACDLVQTHRQAIDRLADYLTMHLAAPDTVIRTIIRENSNLPATLGKTVTRH